MPMIYLNVPYNQKDQAKLHGARWNPNIRTWEIESERLVDLKLGVVRKAFLPWVVGSPDAVVARIVRERDRAIAEAQAKDADMKAKRFAWENDPPRAADPESLLRLMGYTHFSPYGINYLDEYSEEGYETSWFFNDGVTAKNGIGVLPWACDAERRMVMAALEDGWNGYTDTPPPVEPMPPVRLETRAAEAMLAFLRNPIRLLRKL